MSKKKTNKVKAVKKNLLKEADKEHYFYLCDGSVIKNVLELSKCIETMSNEVFGHHVNDMKNDFSSWINDIYSDEKLAQKMLETTDKDKTQIVLLKAVIEKFR
ncbi:MAG: hypothetical protein PHV16_03355 [Candidatus Nanoarchaeia archaeon]|nr:hypothetical protein [Candidatus Nanoarchaeia archaeon]